MSRFSVKEKFQTVQDYLSGKESYSEIGARIGIDYKSVIKWVAFYRAHGMEGLAARYTTYSKEFKMDVLRFMNESGASLLETAVTYNIAAPSAISNWRRILEEEGEDALEPMKKGRLSMKKEKKATPVEGSIEALQAEIQHLRMENAYLKKLNLNFESA
ncbi:Transposase [Paenibacillus konkukensis]|uniref:Transposase n=2 Tax=Paenibacillus TaxID=44249 RepID=A0ABY4RK76_9BACL|nr:helix-turn-helix domain-containing protein [Paenibacillus konkukensis]UQZ81973.1 Transposase [Paenibacillus konkukensis]